jgi:hypothetical protein
MRKNWLTLSLTIFNPISSKGVGITIPVRGASGFVLIGGAGTLGSWIAANWILEEVS